MICYATESIWSVKFTTSVGDSFTLRIALGIISVLALAGVIWLAWRAWKQWDYLEDLNYEHSAGTAEDRHEFLVHAGFLLSVLAILGIIFTGLPLLLINGCL